MTTEQTASEGLARAVSRGSIKVISFDVEGTLVTPDFSNTMWHECIPELYARKTGLGRQQALEATTKEYEGVGDGRLEWYDARYWFHRFQLGDYRDALDRCRRRIALYPEVQGVLSSLQRHYRLIVVSSSIREFLEYLLADIRSYFERVVSTVSDHAALKSPQLYLKVCHGLGVRPWEMVHVGDNRTYDFRNALEAGVHALHLDRGCADNGTIGSLLDLKGLLTKAD